MAIQTKKAGARRVTLGVPDDGALVEFGPAGTNNQVGVMTLQLKSLMGATFVAQVMGRVFGVAADEVDVPFVPIPYRIVSLNNVAQDYSIVSDQITTDATIQVPANGLSVAILFSCSFGSVIVSGWDMVGPSAV